MDWGLASDWGIPPAPERKPIGYWGHQCDGDEPGLNYCCGADRRWIGTKHLTNSGFQRNHFKYNHFYANLKAGLIVVIKFYV